MNSLFCTLGVLAARLKAYMLCSDMLLHSMHASTEVASTHSRYKGHTLAVGGRGVQAI